MSALNYFVDPFDVHSFISINRINNAKYETKGRISIALKAINKKPKTIALGTSRVHPLNMELLENFNKDDTFFNSGIPGATMDEIHAYFLHALYLQPELKQVILGVDLMAFNETRKPQVDFDEDRLCKDHWIFKDWKNVLFTYKAIWASLITLYMSSLDKDYPIEILRLGEEKYLQLMLNTEYKDYKLDKGKVQKFQNLVEICKERSIDLKIFFCPVNSLYWEFYYQNSLWPHVEELKRQLCVIHPLWDLTGFNPFTLETLETDGNLLYQECSHMTEYGGTLVLKRIFGEPSPIDSIGYLLTPDNVESALSEILEQREAWVQANHSQNL